MKILHKEYDSTGIFKAYDENDYQVGEMTYVWAGEKKIIIDHTGIKPGYEGRGIATELVMSAVSFARERGIKITPLCPFAQAVFMRRPEINDVKS
ncbi:MAG: N-acetyltransferase [Prevotellaceae bacterium]|jgi:predicted GNAT family acetyltransferase|nr:N-acetyltransferase [Prevotellaceae bacterium]